MKKFKLIAIVGESGSGKDTLLNQIINSKYGSKFNKLTPFTTRPRRVKESCATYHFVKNEDLDKQQIFAVTCFNNNWFYGFYYNELSQDKPNIAILNPKQVELISDIYNEIDLKIYKLDTSYMKRYKRAIARTPDMKKEILRRLKADEKDFTILREKCHSIILKNNNWFDLWRNVRTIGRAN